MGLCRAMNLLLGAVACGSLTAPLLLPAIATAASVTLITVIADKETSPLPPSRFLLLAPTLIFAAFWIFLLPFCHANLLPAFLCWLLTIVMGGYSALASISVRKKVGWLLLSLIPWQFSLIALTGIHGSIILCFQVIFLSAGTVLLSFSLPQS